MSGTKEGGKRAARRNQELYGKDFYARIGARGGANGTTGGFGDKKIGKDGLTGQERARRAGQLGGQVSRRPKTVKTSQEKLAA